MKQESCDFSHERFNENNSLLTQTDYLNLFKLINSNSDRIQTLEDEFKILSKTINNHYLIFDGEKIEGDSNSNYR